MENKAQRFEDLNIWKEGVELSVIIYSLFNQCKDFGFRDQIQRAAVSISSNIAEGFDRNSNKEFIRFLRIAKGFCAELRTQLIIAERVGLLGDAEEIIGKTRKMSAMIQKLISYRENTNEKGTINPR